MIDILVLNYNDAETTSIFVKSVKSFSSVRMVLVVDNHSTDNSLNKLKLLQEDKVVVIQTEKNGGYGSGNNFGIRYLHKHFKSEYILLCNPDVIITNETCKILENFLRNNQDYALAAPFMLNANGLKENNTAFRIPSKWESILSLDMLLKKFTKTFYYENIANEKKLVKDVGAVSGSMFMMRTEDMLAYGMFDENMFLYCEEMVLGLKMQTAHKKIALLTDSTFIHNHSVSISKTYKSIVSKRKIFLKSRLYVVKQYYHANVVEYLIAVILSKISMIESFFISLFWNK